MSKYYLNDSGLDNLLQNLSTQIKSHTTGQIQRNQQGEVINPNNFATVSAVDGEIKNLLNGFIQSSDETVKIQQDFSDPSQPSVDLSIEVNIEDSDKNDNNQPYLTVDSKGIKFAGLNNTLDEYSKVTSAALNDLNDRIEDLVLDNPNGTETTNAPSVRYVQEAISAIDFNTHVDDTTIKVNSNDKLYVNSLSVDKLTDGTTNKVFTSTEKTKLAGIAQGAEVNVQSDWAETNTSSNSYIKNKPTIATTVTQNDTKAVSGGAVYSELTTVKGYTVNTKAISTNPVLDTSDIVVNSNFTEQNLTNSIEAGDTITEALEKIESNIVDNEEVVASALNDLEVTKADKDELVNYKDVTYTTTLEAVAIALQDSFEGRTVITPMGQFTLYDKENLKVIDFYGNIYTIDLDASPITLVKDSDNTIHQNTLITDEQSISTYTIDDGVIITITSTLHGTTNESFVVYSGYFYSLSTGTKYQFNGTNQLVPVS